MKARGFQKSCYLSFMDYAKAIECVDHGKPWKLKEIGIPDHLTCLLWNLYMGQNATVRTLYGKTDRFKIEKGILQGCLLSPCLFNLYAEHIMRNVELDELQVGIKIGGRNFNNLRYSGMIQKEESETASLKLNIKKKTKTKQNKKLRSWHSAPLFHGKYRGESWK